MQGRGNPVILFPQVTPLFTLGGVYQNLVGIAGFGLGGKIRTYDLSAPNGTHYQAVLHRVCFPTFHIVVNNRLYFSNKVLPLGDKGGAEPQVIMPLGQLHRKTHRLHL